MANILNFGVFLALVSSSFCIHSRNKIYRWTKSVESYQSKGKWLSDHWFFKTSTTMASQCAYRCLKTPICQSFNYDGADGQCELNKNTHLEYPDDFIDAVEEREYHSRDSFSINPEALGPCIGDPCNGRGTCLETRTKAEGHVALCICKPGWAGTRCNLVANAPVWGDWGDWSGCSVTCGQGWHMRKRNCEDRVNKVTIDPLNCYGKDVQYEACTNGACPRWDEWGAWGSCSSETACGRGRKFRHRKCTNGGTPDVDRYCMGPTNQSAPCTDIKCNGLIQLKGGSQYGEGRVEVFNDLTKEWGLVCADQWDSFAADLVCRQLGMPGAFAAVTDGRFGNGAKQYSVTSLTCTGRERTLQMCKRNPWSLSTSCPGTSSAAGVQCNVNGVWSLWGPWGSCSVTCADGVEQRTRQCNHPPALHGGKPCPGEALETRPCSRPACPVDGVWMSWESWTTCSLTCGEGVHTRSRQCKGPFFGGKDCPGSDAQTDVCKIIDCPVDGAWDVWQRWGACSVTCGGGQRKRQRTCNEPLNAGSDCIGDAVVVANCNTNPCPIDGYWRDWTQWTACNVTCGGGRQSRERVCVEPKHGGKACSGAPDERRDCNTHNCPVDGHWMDWGSWGTCNVSCGGGTQQRIRVCYHGKHGGIDCFGGNPEEERRCNQQNCPVDGVWAVWGVWAKCTLTCGNGTQARSRTCRGPFYGGRDCGGSDLDTRHCNTQPCPVDGVWDEWTSWSACDVSCGNGTMRRKRACAGPYFGGQNCSGALNEIVHCFVRPCPVDGVWQMWGAWSTCPVSCGGGAVSRHRSCDGPFHGGKDCLGNLAETQPCGSDPCPIDGYWESWSGYSTCSTTCGGGMQLRNRTCIRPKHGGAECEGVPEESRSCSDKPCPVDGVFESWTDWSTCTSTCGGGVTVRTRRCIEPLHGGSNCSGARRQTNTCNTQPCPVDGVWKPWRKWSACDVSCGGGTRMRLRECDGPYFGGKPCNGSESETEACNVHECPIDGVWTTWSDWDTCSRSCGGGVQWRTRNCTGPFYGGKECADSANQSRDCNINPCPVDGYFNEWAQWSECGVTCGGGVRWRNRTCIGPFYGGSDCEGPRNETEVCNSRNCPVDGVFSDWSDWGECSVSCGGGVKWRSRTCIGPFYNGADCVGAWNDSKSCNEQNCPVDGVYSDWSAWSACTVTCGGGTQWHTRACNGPFFGGLPCQGPVNETQACMTQPCPIDGVYSHWSQWDTCTVTCGGGTQSRSRTCSEPQYGGRTCQGPREDWQDCNSQNCPVDGVWYSWSAWGACNATCGGGSRERTRECEQPKYGGADCAGHAAEYLVCNENVCPIPGDWFLWEPWTLCSRTCAGGRRQRTRECDMTSYGDLTAPCAGDAKEVEDCHTFDCTPYAATCTEWGERGLKESTMAHINPSKRPASQQQQPVLVYCDMASQNGTGVTVIGHDQQKEEEVIGYEGAGEFQMEINYNVTLEEAFAIIDTSESCKQFISWKCKAALIHNPNSEVEGMITTGWMNRTRQLADYFGGGSPGSGNCACGMTHSCVDPTVPCNCDMNDDVWREDSGYLTYKDDLPVLVFVAGDTGADYEMGKARVGNVLCTGTET